MAELDDRTLILADIGRKAIAQVRQGARELLSRKLAPDKAAALAEKLSSGLWTHDYPIFAADAVKLGLRSPPRRPMKSSLPERCGASAQADRIGV